MPLAPGDPEPDPPAYPDLGTIQQQAEWYLEYLNWQAQHIQSNMTAATIAKIRGHKLGRRKLTGNGALLRTNKILRAAGPDLAAAINGDAKLTQIVADINTHLRAFLTALGLGAAAGQGSTVEAAEITAGQIPSSVWNGYIDIPTGQETGDTRAACHAAELSYADDCGKLRARLSLIIKTIGTLNDIGNSDQKPNKGGVVGDGSHDHNGGEGAAAAAAPAHA